jgi:hypothetical protein
MGFRDPYGTAGLNNLPQAVDHMVFLWYICVSHTIDLFGNPVACLTGLAISRLRAANDF